MIVDGFLIGLGVFGLEWGMVLVNLLGILVFMIVKIDDGFEECFLELFKFYL